uniref:NADH-ubiquinone oxidoreductase chain 6 n=1 Tax=Paralimna concors TaxID=2818145 RepID=A0A8A2H833_9MUSC|nr:NADH dehydrogenase subunit 6 [Paralimna concors]QSV37208.1 NADH dehydrogenase subunit 6 [Paralimna concors]
MIQLMLMTTMLLTGIMFLNMIHPLAMGLTLLIQTLLICLITGLMSKSFWFSYILFLIFLGGMLVLFIYVTSLASNEMFSMSTKLLLMNSMVISIMMFILLLIDNNFFLNWMTNNDMFSNYILNYFIPENSLNLNKLYNFPTNFTSIMLMNYLLITLIAIVKITKLSKGPLRLMN